MPKKSISPKQQQELLSLLKSRFEKNMKRHKALKWEALESRLKANPDKLWTLNEMESSGGEPDVVEQDKKTGEYVFFDCAEESPKGRRSYCYDGDALASRKENKPKN